MSEEKKRLQITLGVELQEALQNDQTLWTETERWRYEKYNSKPAVGELVQRSVARDQRVRSTKAKTDRFNNVQTS